MGSCGQVLPLDDPVQYHLKLEEVLSDSSHKQRHIECHSFTVLLPRLHLYVDLQVV